MKKLIYLFFAVSVIFSACEKEITNGNLNSNNGNNGNSDYSFSVIIGVDADTYSPAELNITWKITEDSTGLIIAEGTEASNFESYTLDSNSCYTVEMTSSGDGWGDYFLIVGVDDIATIWYGQLESGSNGIDYFCPFVASTNDIYGCMDPGAFNYNAEATEDDGSCIYPGDESWDCDPSGCYDPGTGNGQYSSVNDCQIDCGSAAESWNCDPVNSGCYDPGTGDGQYNSLYDCQMNCEPSSGIEMTVMVTGSFSPSEISWEIYDPSGSGTPIFSGGAGMNAVVCIPSVNLGSLEFRMYDSFGDGWEGDYFTLSTFNGTIATGTLDGGDYGVVDFNLTEGEPCFK
jgi:hypothetical protein